MKMSQNQSGLLDYSTFINGTCYGFDIGTSSIGWCIRKGKEILDVGVLICDDKTSDLSARRSFRRSRRTTRSRKARRLKFANKLAELLELDLHAGTALPKSGWIDDGNGHFRTQIGFEKLQEPIRLRQLAIEGVRLEPVEIFTALTHLLKRRGYLANVPWAKSSEIEKEDSAEKEEGEMRRRMENICSQMDSESLEYPCQLLNHLARNGKAQRGKAMVWPRELLEKEFRAILENQSSHYPDLKEKADELLHGTCKKVSGQSVYFKKGKEQPGVMSLHWPRFDNRDPGLDSLQPYDSEGRPLHVVRKNKETFANAQWELALLNFRVLDNRTGEKVMPKPESLSRLREIWESGRALARKKGKKIPEGVTISIADLKKWIKDYSEVYELLEGQQALTPQTVSGRAKYSSPTLKKIQSIIQNGGDYEPPQPILKHSGQSQSKAIANFMSQIPHPLVRHRLTLFSNLLDKLLGEYGEPDFFIVEAARSIALGKKKKNELSKTNKENQERREDGLKFLRNRNLSPSKNNILRFRLWKEFGTLCPYCLEEISQDDFNTNRAEIEHIVPKTKVVSNEWENLTLAHHHCNQKKDGRTPYEAFGKTPEWSAIRDKAKQQFKGRKLEIFLAEDAEQLIESKAALQQTAYIAKQIRKLVVIKMDWLDEKGRDPTTVSNNPALRFQFTNGHITSRLRDAWGLNQLLNPLPSNTDLSSLDFDERQTLKEQQHKKNRGDHRHHAIDAMVIACSLPWYASHSVQAKSPDGEDGWWELDPNTRRESARNPVYPNISAFRSVVMEWIRKVEIEYHNPSKRHAQQYHTTLLGKKAKDTYVARKPLTDIEENKISSGKHGIWPERLGKYIETAWEKYKADFPEYQDHLEKRNKKFFLPSGFIECLCFSQFQAWRAEQEKGQESELKWLPKPKIPIKKVGILAVQDDSAVYDMMGKDKSYVKRQAYREVKVFPSKDGKDWIPVFYPSWKKDKPVYDGDPDWTANPVAIIKKNDVIELKKSKTGGKLKAGKYVVYSTGQKQLELFPHFLTKEKDTLKAHGYPATGVKPYWKGFMAALGHELPYTPSTQSESAR